jgi:IS5 family transposase
MMKQMTLSASGFHRYSKTTRRAAFLAEMDRVVPWSELCALIEPFYPKPGNGRPPVGVERMLRIYFLQQWFNLSDPAVEEALYDSSAMRRFVDIDLGREPVPDETTVCRFRHLLEAHDLGQQLFDEVQRHLAAKGLKVATGTIVDATIINAPSSTKNAEKARDPEMHQTKKGNAWHFGMKAHIGVDAESGLVHTVISTAANVNDVTQAGALLHGDETTAFGDAGYRGVGKREEAQGPHWHVAMQPGKRRQLDPTRKWAQLLEQAEQLKASIRAKVEHPFHVIKNLFRHKKVRYKGLAKNEAQLFSLFGLANLVIAKRSLLTLHARGTS